MSVKFWQLQVNSQVKFVALLTSHCLLLFSRSVLDEEEDLDDSTSLLQDTWEAYCNKVASNEVMPEVRQCAMELYYSPQYSKAISCF